jgi:hypothetical protein
MIKVILVLCVCGWMLTSCSSGESKTGNDDKVAGVYVREYSKEILNQMSGNKVGMTTFRDTIRIKKSDDGYHVVNTKWRMNDYDQDGWQDMKHGESRPLPEFDASYDEGAKALNPKVSGIVPALYIEQGQLSVGPKSKIAYTKID